MVSNAQRIPIALAAVVGFFLARACKFNPWIGAGLAGVACWLWLKRNPTGYEAMNTLQEDSNTVAA